MKTQLRMKTIAIVDKAIHSAVLSFFKGFLVKFTDNRNRFICIYRQIGVWDSTIRLRKSKKYFNLFLASSIKYFTESFSTTKYLIKKYADSQMIYLFRTLTATADQLCTVEATASLKKQQTSKPQLFNFNRCKKNNQSRWGLKWEKCKIADTPTASLARFKSCNL